MSVGLSSDSDVVNTFGFSVPCRRFHFSYEVTHDRRLPVVDEFVLRLLALGDALPAARIGSFLGLSARELSIVLEDLQARDLVSVQGEAVCLSRQSREAFRLAEGSPPRVVEVSTWSDAIWIDLVSRNVIPASTGRPAAHLVPLQVPASSRDLQDEHAKWAFERDFRKVVTQVRGMKNPERFRLYSVSEVVPDRFGSVSVRAEQRLFLDPSPHTTVSTTLEEADGTGRLRALLEAVQAGVRRLPGAATSATALQDFKRLTADTSLAGFSQPDGSLRLREWFARTNAEARGGRVAVYGQAYVARNVERFASLLRRGVASQSPKRPRISLFWLRPAGDDWGATPDLASALADLSGALKPGLARDGAVETTLLAAAGLRKGMASFRRVFDRGLILPQANLAGGIEALVVEGVAAMVTVRISVGGSVVVPVGLILTSPDDLARLERVLRLSAALGEGDLLWRSGRERPVPVAAAPAPG